MDSGGVTSQTTGSKASRFAFLRSFSTKGSQALLGQQNSLVSLDSYAFPTHEKSVTLSAATTRSKMAAMKLQASEGDGDDTSSDDEDVAAAEKMLGDASSCPVCGATATTRELLVAHCVARHVWDAGEVRRRRAARPPRRKRRRAADDLDDFIVADDEDVEEYDSSGS